MNKNIEIKTVFVGDIAFNTDITPQQKITSLGGAAYYSSVGAIAALRAAGLNQAVGIVATVGDDYDQSNLINKGIDIQGIAIKKNEKTCCFTLTQHQDNSREFIAERHVAENVDTETFPYEYLSSDYIHLATSLPQHYLIWLEFLSNKSKANISSDAFETFSQQFPEETIEALNRSNLIFLNEEEANILSHYSSLKTNIPWVLKRGASGASYIYGHNEVKIPAPKVRAIETTGAGDVLAGAFLALLARGFEIEESLVSAVRIASQSVTQFGVDHLLT